MISPGQTIHVDRVFRREWRLISDINDVCDIEKLSRYLMTIDFEKAFNSMNHPLLIAALKKYGSGDNFIDWIKILWKNQESCVINRERTAKYFKLERGTCQWDPVSANLYILALEIIFFIIKTNKNIHGLKIFDHEYLNTAYVDDILFRRH